MATSVPAVAELGVWVSETTCVTRLCEFRYFSRLRCSKMCCLVSLCLLLPPNLCRFFVAVVVVCCCCLLLLFCFFVWFKRISCESWPCMERVRVKTMNYLEQSDTDLSRNKRGYWERMVARGLEEGI